MGVNRQFFGNLLSAAAFSFRVAPGWTTFGFICVFVTSSLPVVSLYAMKRTIDEVQFAQSHGSTELKPILFWIAIAAAAAFLNTGARSLLAFVNEIQGERTSQKIQELIAAKSAKVDLAYYETSAYYDTLHRAQTEAPYRPTRIISTMATSMETLLSLLAIGSVVLLALNWTIAAVLALVAVPGVWMRVRNSRAVYAWQKGAAAKERSMQYFNHLGASPGAAKEVRVFGLAKEFMLRARAAREAFTFERMRFSRSRLVSELLVQACACATMVGAFGELAHRTLHGRLSIGSLVMSVQAYQRVVSLVNEFVSCITQLYEHGLFMGRLSEFLHLKEKIKDPPKPKKFPKSLGDGIVFNEVSFRYATHSRPIIDGVTLRIATGEMAALVGDNGAGKSTLIKLLCRLYEPTAGAITIGGVDIREFDRADLWAHMGVLFQDFGQYQATVRDNVWFGNCARPPSPSDLRNALECAGADGMVDGFSKGPDQVLGNLFDGGVELSGGQWQKIALSRAFYRNAPIIILDEPSSALDVKAEHDLFMRFKRLTRGRTSLIISHRMSTVRMADRIYYLSGGRVTEAGCHDELIEQDGEYARLFMTQARSYRD